jgi:NADP-dependent 3-hydroxy acid dehydrogenase YdfG
MVTDKVVLITGAFSGIGKAVAEIMMQAQAKVVAVGRNGENKVPSFRSNYLPVIRNIKSKEDGEAIVEFALEKFKHIDIILHCAGKGILKPATQLQSSDFEKMMQDNFFSALHVTQAALPHLISRNQGMLIYFPGILGKTTMPQSAAYSASKYALTGYAKSLKEDLKRTQLRISTLYFGGVNSEFWNEIDLSVRKDQFISVQEAARAVWFVCQQNDNGVLSELVLQPFSHQAI